MTESAVIFPGQGAQAVGMGKDLADRSPRARQVFTQANDILGFDIATFCFEGPASELEKTDIQQPAIFVTSVAIWEAFLEAGGTLKRFRWAGGLSLGEYTALHVTGAVGFDEALRLVRRRGELMQQAAAASPSGMVSVIGADAATAEKLCDRARHGQVLAPANFNCPGQVVISGSRDACDRAAGLAGEFQCRAVALPVAGAFHSPLMTSAADELWPVLQGTGFSRPRIPVVSNVNAEPHGDAGAIRKSLRRQVTQPVLWQRCVKRMINDGVEDFVEIGPGRILTGMIRKIDRKKPVLSLNSANAIAGVMERIGTG